MKQKGRRIGPSPSGRRVGKASLASGSVPNGGQAGRLATKDDSAEKSLIEEAGLPNSALPHSGAFRFIVEAAGIYLMTGGILLGLLSILASAQGVAFGIWSDTETMTIVVFCGAAVSAAGLGIDLASGQPGVAEFRHPTVMLALLLALWGAVCATAARFPLAAIFGPPQTGEGVVWWCAFAMYILAALRIRKTRQFQLMTGLLTLVAAGVSVLNFLAHRGALAAVPLLEQLIGSGLLSFDEFEAYFALALFGLAAVGFSRDGRITAKTALTSVVGLLALLQSHNRSGQIAIFLAFVLALPISRRPMAWIAAAPLRIAGLVALLLVTPILLVRNIDLYEIAPTLWSRGGLYAILDTSLTENWLVLVLGHGFGSYGEIFARDLNLGALPVHGHGEDWSAMTRDMFHSHNTALEALFALGIPGLLLRLALSVSIVRSAAPGYRQAALAFIVAWSITDAFWFMLPCALPGLALAIAGFTEPIVATRPTRARLLAFAVFGTALCLMTAAVSLTVEAFAMSRLAACLPPQVAESDCLQVPIPVELRQDNAGLATLVSTSIGPAVGAGAALPETDKIVMRSLLTRALAVQKSASTVVLGIAMADALAQIAFSDHGIELLPPDSKLENVWPSSLEALIAVAPRRLDVFVPYLNWLVGQHRTDDLARAIAFLQKTAPNHVLTLWFAGLIDIGSDDASIKRTGIRLMRLGLDGGIEHYLPIEPRIRSLLERGTTG